MTDMTRRMVRIGLLVGAPLLILAGVGVIALGLGRFIGGMGVDAPPRGPGGSGRRGGPPPMPGMGDLWPVYVGIGLIAAGYLAFAAARAGWLSAGPAPAAEPEPPLVPPSADPPEAALCPGCGAINQPGAKFCTACGQVIVARLHCPGCGQVNQPGDEFCAACGWHL